MLVREVMSTSPVTVLSGTTIHTALHTLASASVTSLPVVSTRGQLRGIVSEADLIRDRVPHDPRMHVLQSASEVVDRHEVVDEVMTTHVVSVGPDTDIVDAVELLTATAVKSLPVVDHTERVLGMLSRSDVVRSLAGSDDEIGREVDAALVSVGLRDWWVQVRDGAVDLVGPAGTHDEGTARVVAGTVRGVVSVRVRDA
jgi:CBS domain-containing protein